MENTSVEHKRNKRIYTLEDGFSLADIPNECSLLERARVDLTQEVPKPEPILLVGGQIWGTLGNFSTVIGKAKSRKTFLMVLLAAACAKSSISEGLLEGQLSREKSQVAYVDTEQGTYHLLKTAHRIIKLTDGRGSNTLSVYSARSLSTPERVSLIEQVITSTPDLGVLIVDGVRDLLTSINDEEQATELTNKFLKWTEEFQIHIVSVLHQNKGDRNARGHIGTELMNKSETVVSVTVDNTKMISKVDTEYCRNKDFESFAFFVNDDGLPEIAEEWEPEITTRTYGKVQPHNLDEVSHKEILKRVKEHSDKNPGYGEIISQIKDAVGDVAESIGDTKAKAFYTYYENRGFITRRGKKRSPKSYYEVNLDV